jgi:hypothetical protein
VDSTNVSLGDTEDRSMTTGLHTVKDIHCAKCGETLGWKYSASTSSCSLSFVVSIVCGDTKLISTELFGDAKSGRQVERLAED